MVMAVQAPNSKQGNRCQTLKLLARIGKQQVLILVDSGSIGTFISDKLVDILKLSVQACASASFKAADGGQLQCNQQVSGLQWWIQGHTFTFRMPVYWLCIAMI
jgi:5S rRNA maturation endonuclease (ribonuclease M5)